MRADWQRYAQAPDLEAAGSSVVVALANGRRHTVRIEESDDGYVLEAVVAGRQVERGDDAVMRAWLLNRCSRLVGYRVDRRGRLVAHVWSPRDGMTKAMFLVLVRTLAREADRHELLLTGADRR
jgi:hypothetical protein